VHRHSVASRTTIFIIGSCWSWCRWLADTHARFSAWGSGCRCRDSSPFHRRRTPSLTT
jgi:hypothetical protein